MKKLFLFFLGLPVLLFGQVYDDFSDGNFSEDPIWTGSIQKFTVNNGFQLQLNDTAASTAFLSTANLEQTASEWRFWVKLGFSPSANNQSRVYVMSDQEDLSQPLNGYFIQLGEAGSDDAIELFRQQGENTYPVCRGEDGTISTSFAMNIKVTRTQTGTWSLFTDPDGQGQYRFEAEGTDDEISGGDYLGVFCKYTVSNASRFYFDDIYAGPMVEDDTPPVLLHIRTETDSSLSLAFNESIDSLGAVTKSNYFVDKGIGHPVSIDYAGNYSSQVILSFATQFEDDVNYLLAVSQLTDLAGNMLHDTLLPFSNYLPAIYDVTINEIMADPTPQVGLPDHEYLELFNQSKYYIDLTNWTLSIGSSEKSLSGITLGPDEFLLLGEEAARPDLSVYGKFYGFPDISLTNTGQELTLLSDKMDTISHTMYEDSWYGDPAKKGGGWSLEQINPANICSANANWTASMDFRGGTPGEMNSVFNDTVVNPRIASFELAADNIIRLNFNQQMNAVDLGNPENYRVDHGHGSPDTVYLDKMEEKMAELYFKKAFTEGIVYRLTVHESVSNCMGIAMLRDTSLAFGMGEEPGFNDIVINEILFNPLGDGADYVELYNRSEKVIDLLFFQLGVGRISPPNPVDTSYYDIYDRQYMFLPGNYLLLTSSAEAVLGQYAAPDPDAIQQFYPFPGYANEQGICLLRYGNDEIIDAFHYHEDMHFPLLTHTDGVALERISPGAPTQDPMNWSSAAENVGFGTPGYLNSQFLSNAVSAEPITIVPKIFSPDHDGYNDTQAVSYAFDKAGYVLSVDIFNQDGRLVRRLADNEYAGTEGKVIWDGTQDNRRRCPVGIYIYYIRILDTDGHQLYFKKTGVLATRL